jgi:hypothetical protein
VFPLTFSDKARFLLFFVEISFIFTQSIRLHITCLRQFSDVKIRLCDKPIVDVISIHRMGKTHCRQNHKSEVYSNCLVSFLLDGFMPSVTNPISTNPSQFRTFRDHSHKKIHRDGT